MHEGKITSIVWDNLCANCGSSECAESQSFLDDKMVPGGGFVSESGTCGMPMRDVVGVKDSSAAGGGSGGDSSSGDSSSATDSDAEAVAVSPGGGKATDFKIFLTWAGTDTEGRPAKSSSFRFSKFAGATLKDMWSWTKTSYNDAWG